jgi:hypothetical protein
VVVQPAVGIDVEVVVDEVEVVVDDDVVVEDDVVVVAGGRRRAGCPFARKFAATVSGSSTSIAAQRARRPTTVPQACCVRARSRSVKPSVRDAPALGMSVSR